MPVFRESRYIYFIGEEETKDLGKIVSKTGRVQKYDEIIKKHSATNPFLDDEFPHTNESIGNLSFDSANNTSFPNWDKTFKWIRVKDLAPSGVAVFSTKREGEDQEFSVHDIKQGVIGDCWFLCVLAELTRRTKFPEMFQLIIPKNNQHNNDSGAYHFRLFHNGIWVDVVVDDYIPCVEFDGPGSLKPLGANPPIFGDGKIEFWMSLVEKAYAKVKGSYANIEVNFPKYAMEDLTGGLAYSVPLEPPACDQEDVKAAFFTDLNNYFRELSTLIAFGTDRRYTLEELKGLRQGHAYSMTGIAKLDDGTRLLKIRNPWGVAEWEGDWSDNSPKWDTVPQEKKKELGVASRNDGEFWMSLDDAFHYFVILEILTALRSYAKVGEPSIKIEYSDSQHAKWSIEEGTAGGYQNPAGNRQFIVFLGNNGLTPGCFLRLGLSIKVPNSEARKYCYGFLIYKIEGTGDPSELSHWEWGKFGYGKDFFEDKRVQLVASSPGPTNGLGYFGREAVNLLSLPPGTYIVVPVTHEPNVEVEFYLRIWNQATSLPEVTSIQYTGVDIEKNRSYAFEQK